MLLLAEGYSIKRNLVIRSTELTILATVAVIIQNTTKILETYGEDVTLALIHGIREVWRFKEHFFSKFFKSLVEWCQNISVKFFMLKNEIWVFELVGQSRLVQDVVP